MGRHQQHLWRQRGSATAEFAICLPAVLLVVLLVLTLAAVSLAQLRCADAARAGARAAALGEDSAAVSRIATTRAGPDAWVEVSSDGDWVTVRVGRPVLGSQWGTWQVVAEFAARAEPTARPAPATRTGPDVEPLQVVAAGSAP